MASLNRVLLIGNLGKDPELRYTKNQTPFARFSLATTDEYTSNSGEKIKKTEWHNLVVWGKQAEIAGRYLRKGKQIYVEGRLEYRDYEDQSGQRRYITDVRVERFLMLGPAPSGQGGYDDGQPAYQGGSDSGPQSYGGDSPDRPGSYGGPKQGNSQANYGKPMSEDDIPESDSFSDDDIPF